MCGDNVLETISANWARYFPMILKLNSLNLSIITQDDELEAMRQLDHSLRCAGPGAHAQAVFSVFKVRH